jgi:hypothetical protein
MRQLARLHGKHFRLFVTQHPAKLAIDMQEPATGIRIRYSNRGLLKRGAKAFLVGSNTALG